MFTHLISSLSLYFIVSQLQIAYSHFTITSNIGIYWSMSTMPSIYSDELTMALAAGKWWAMVEIAFPISEEPEYGGMWGDLVEAQDTLCPTSLVFSDASEKAQRRSQHAGFSDATRKTTKRSRQKIAQGGSVPARSKQGASVPDWSPHGTPVAAPKDNVGLCQAPPQKLYVETHNLNEKMQQQNFNLESHNHQASRRRPEIRSSLRRGSQLSRKKTSDNAGVDPKGVPVHSGAPQVAPVPDGSPHGTPVAAPKVLYVETNNLNEKTEQQNFNLESHNHQASRRRPEIRSSLRRGSQLSRKTTSDNAGVDPKSVPVHSGTPQVAPVPDGSPHGTPVAAPKDNVGLCQAPPQKLYVETDNLNEKTQQQNFNLESHNHQASRRRPEIRSSLRRGSQLSRKKTSDNTGVDPKSVPVHSGAPQVAPVPDGSPHGTPVAAPKVLYVETNNLNEKTEQQNFNMESHNRQASRRRPEIRSSLRRGSQLSRKTTSDNAGVDPKSVPVHSGAPQVAPVPDGSPHGTPVAAPKVLYVETNNLNEKTEQQNFNLESHNHQASRRRPEIRSSLRRGSQLSRKTTSDNAGVDPKSVPVHSGTPQVAPVPDGSPHGTPVAAPKDNVGLCQAPPQKLYVETDNLNEKTQQQNFNLESHNHQASRRRPEIRSSLRRGSQLSRKKTSDNTGVDPKSVPVHSGAPQVAPVPDGSPHGTPVAAPKVLYVETNNLNEKTEQQNFNMESHNRQASRRRPEIRSSLRRGSQLSRKTTSDNAGVDPKSVPVHSGAPQVAPVPDGSPHGTPVAAPKVLYVETVNLNEKMQEQNLNLESHNHQASRRRPEIRSSLRRGSQLSRKKTSDNAGVDPKGVPVHSETPQGAPVPDGSPHGTPVAAPKVLYVETVNLNEKVQEQNFNMESHNHQSSRRRPEIRSSLRRGSQLSHKKTSDNAGVDLKGVPVHSGTPQGAPVPDGSPHGTPVAAPKVLYVETVNLNEKGQEQNFNMESHNHQSSRRRPEIRSSLRRGSQLSRKKTSDNAGVDPKGVPVHSETPQGAPVPDGSPHGTPVAAPKVLYVETVNLNEKVQEQNFNMESHNHQSSRRRPEIRSSLRRGSQLSHKKTSDNAGVDLKGVPVHSGTPQGAPVPDGSPHGTPVAAPKVLYVETVNLNEKVQEQNFNMESHNHQSSRRRPEIRSSLRRGSQLSHKKTSDNAGVDLKGVPVHSGTPQVAPVPDGSPHGTPVAAPKVLYMETDNLNEKTQQQNLNLESHNHQASRWTPEIWSSLWCGSQLSRKRALDNAGVDQSPPRKKQRMAIEVKVQQSEQGSLTQMDHLCSMFTNFCTISNDNLNEKTQQQNLNLESHNHQASRRRPEIRSSLRRGSQLSRKKTLDNAGVDPKGVPVHLGTPQVAPVPDGSPHGTPVAAPKVLYMETDNLNEKTQQQNLNLESHNHQASRRRPEIRSSLRRGSQLSRKKTLDNAGVDLKGVPVHSGTPKVAPVPDGSPHGTPVAAPKVLYVETVNLNEKTQQQNLNLESHNHQASRRRPEIRSSLRRGSQLSRKKTSDNAGVDLKGVPVHSGTPQVAPVPDGSPHGTPVAAPKVLYMETDNLNEKTQQQNLNLESHNHQASRRRHDIRSSLRRGSQLSRKKTSDNAGVDLKGVPVHSGTPKVAPVPDGSPHGTPVAAPKVLYVETVNLNEKTQQQNLNLESHNHQASRRRPEIRSSLRRGSQLSRKKTSDNAGVDLKGVPVHSGTPQVAPVPDGSPHGTPVAAPKVLYMETDNLNEKTQQQNLNLESHNHQASRRRPDIRSSLRRGSQLSRKKTLDNAGVDPKGVPVHLGTPQVAPVPDGSSHGTPVAAPKVLYMETDNLNEKTQQQQNLNLESHNHQASRRRPEIRSSLRRGSQLSRKKTSDNAGVDLKGVPVHSGTPKVAPVPDGSPHGTPVAAPKVLYVETVNLNEKTQQQNFNLESHNHQSSRWRPEIWSSLWRGSQLSRKRALDNEGVDQSPPRKKQRMAIEVKVQQSEQGSLTQMDHLCSMFTNFCIISNI
ncbi:uncharacterized protein LOC125267456 isoform X3 [Megalobrama amblycephala]|uniref:uncharacterized protein LOC125267456 isoform X3 n=1 Tax=Megalobrama amblycephala TaxID=75352 RepID=UPI00201455AF|nr:uncharacterized protein LOC125267456 isoform X3 [Megalobrama amblycephala]